MGLYRRKKDSNFYFKKKLYGKVIRFSLGTKNYRTAWELHDLYLKDNFLEFRRIKESKKSKQMGKSPNNDNQSFSKVFDEFMKLKFGRVAKSTLNVYKHMYKLINVEKINNLTSQKLSEIFFNIQKKYQQNSARKFIAAIKTFLKYAVKQEYYSLSDYKKIEFPKISTKVRDVLINESDLDKILDYLKKNDPEFYLYFTSLYNLCCRPAEILGIRKVDFDLKSRTVRIFMHKTQKTKVIPIINDEYFSFISKTIQELDDNAYICSNRNKEHFSKKFKVLKKILNLNPQYTLYSVRHSAATRLYNQTKDSKFLSLMLGNNVDLVMKTYVNPTLSDYIGYQNVL